MATVITAEYIGDNVLDPADRVTIGKEYTFVNLTVLPGAIKKSVRGVLIDDQGELYVTVSHVDNNDLWKLASF
jgi:hypothetical protein